MKKILALGTMSIILAGCSMPGAAPTPTPAPTPQTAESAVGEFTEVAQAIVSGKSAACTMTSPEGASMKFLAKGEKVRMSIADPNTTAPGATMETLTDSEFMYTWDPAKKEGMKFSMAKSKELAAQYQQPGAQVPDLSDPRIGETYADLGIKVDCEVTAVPDSEFTPPTDVKFTDTSAMMETLQKATSQSPSGSPAMNQKDIEELMKAYQPAN